MGLFRRDPPEPEKPMNIPRETRVWPKAMPAARPAAAQPPPLVQAKPAPPAAVARAVPPPPSTSSAPTRVKPLAAAPTTAASEGKHAEPPPPAASRDASSVVAAFASWKQATSVKTAGAGKTETAAAPVAEGRREDPVMYVYRAAAKQARGEHDAAIDDL